MSSTPRPDPVPAGHTNRLADILWLWGPALAGMAALFWASSLQDLGPLPGDISDKSGHFAAYAVLGALVLHGTSGGRWSGVTPRSGVAAWLICTVYGATDEFHQSFVPGRTMALDDWVADTTGAGAAILCLVLVARVLRRRRHAV